LLFSVLTSVLGQLIKTSTAFMDLRPGPVSGLSGLPAGVGVHSALQSD
jgi:hypothetical protein